MYSFVNIRRKNDPINDPEKEKRHLYVSIFLPLLLVAALWLVKFLEIALDSHFSFLGVLPRQAEGLPGILTSPFIHKDLEHLFSNSLPLLVLGFFTLQSYPKVAHKVFLWVFLFSGVLLWFIGRPAYHIGASGLVYGLAFFLFFSGVFRQEIRSIALALLVAFLYGSIVWGLLPYKIEMSWEAHLAGAFVGAVCAYIYRNVDRPGLHQWEEEDEIAEAGLSREEMKEGYVLYEEIHQNSNPSVRYLYVK